MRLYLIILFLVGAYSTSFSQVTFQKYLTIYDSTLLSRKIVETADGNIAVTGVLEFRRPNQQPPLHRSFLTKLTPTGEVTWTLRFNPGAALLMYIDDLEATPDGGVIALMMSKDDYGTKHHPHIVKISSAGVVEWTKIIPGTTYFFLNGIQKISDGFLVTGVNYGITGSLVMKMDESGNILWSRNFDNVMLLANRVAEDTDGNLYLAGGLNTNMSALASKSLPLLVKLNAAGEQQWAKLYTDQFTDQTPLTSFLAIRKCLLVNNRLYLFSNNFASADLVINQTDLDGNLITQKRFNNGQMDSFFPFLNAFTNEKGNIIAATYDSNIDNRPVMFELTPSMEMNWMKSYRKEGVEVYNFADMNPLKDYGGFLFTGTYYETDHQNTSIVKTDINGEFSGRCCARTERVFQGVTAEATVIDTVLTLLEPPLFTAGTVNHELITAQIFQVCTSTSSSIAQADTLICPGACTRVEVVMPEQGSAYSWAFPNAITDTSTALTSQVCYAKMGEYTFFLQQEGCLIDSSHLKVDGRPEVFPNAFTPNGDGNNERFQPIGQCPVEEYSLQIFNRWGERVYTSTELHEGWDGTINGQPAPVDVYIYQVAYFAYVNGVRTMLFNEKKEVTLLR